MHELSLRQCAMPYAFIKRTVSGFRKRSGVVSIDRAFFANCAKISNQLVLPGHALYWRTIAMLRGGPTNSAVIPATL